MAAMQQQQQATYVGDLSDRLRHGRGTYTFPRGMFQYTGEWHRGKMHGRGVFSIGQLLGETNGGGSVYEGEFENGEIEGVGLRRWANGDSYSGQFHRGEMHGEGVFLSHTGDKYDGEWRANQRVGTGELTLANGDVYTGAFAHNKPHGLGTIVYALSRQTCTGAWQSGALLGTAVLYDRDGAVLYNGEWVCGQREGQGSGAVMPEDVSDDSDTSADDGLKPVWYSGMWTCNRPAARASRLEVKVVSSRTRSVAGAAGSSNSRPASAAASARSAEQQQLQVEEEVLLDLPSTLNIESKTLPHLVVLSIRDPEGATGTSELTIVQGESRRQIRLRVFEGQFDPTTAAAVSARASLTDEQQVQVEQESGQPDTPRSAQWYFVLPDSTSATSATDTSASPQTAQERDAGSKTPPVTAADDAEPEEIETKECRVSEVVVETSDGRASVQGLALPAVTLPGSYYILCESIASSDTLPPVVIHLAVA